ncbi:MAG TPA: PEP/pyruvate-binding domain-containing protein, partial [Bacillota bacterium]|nr:PEP/pyruvate-binding domain-containing protein [Bacillota bacterium]
MVFERATSGLPGLDRILDGLRLGDNIVLQVDDVNDFAHFVRPFAKQAIADQKRLIYFRFGQHAPIIQTMEGLEVHAIDASKGFESFSSEIRNLVTQAGEGAYYIFDCLSELLSEWSNDLMIGNFFRVTCPYLFKLRTIAFFALIRERHSNQTVARIRDTTQLLLDVYHKDESYYIHPLKVWKRYSPLMFLPHIMSGDEFLPLTNSADVARLFAAYPQRGLGDVSRRLDYWDHIFLKAAELAKETVANDPAESEQRRTIMEQLLHMVIGRDENILALARRYFTLEDLLQIKSRLIGSGFIGGKAVGLLLARAILSADPNSDWNAILEPHDSFYIGSDVYYTYLVENDCWELRQKQKDPEHYFSTAAELRNCLLEGSFPEDIRDQIYAMLEYFGQSPIIVRSSSLLEDGFGN